jgi:membrane fusion protein, multidrug efflux system
MRLPRPAGPLVILGFAALSLALAGCQQPEGSPQGDPGGAAPVTVVTLKTAPVTLTRELPGRSTAYLVAEVRPQVDGIVLQRLFTEGARVEKGQPLYQLDDARYRADFESAAANLARAKATLLTAELNAKRSQQLVQIDAVSRQDDENAAAALRQAQADIRSAQAAVDRARVVLDYARITSPITGRIGKSTVTQGALVTANQAAPLATVQQLDPIYVDLTQSSAEWLQLRQEFASGRMQGVSDVPVTILLEDGTKYAHSGKLAFSDVTVDPTTGSFGLRVLVPNTELLLLPGMYVRAVVGTGERRDALLVPQQGVARGPKGSTTAMVVGEDGKAQIRDIRVSRAIGDQWLVEDGLVAGDRVIVEGLQKIQPGAPVQATEFVPQAGPAGEQ